MSDETMNGTAEDYSENLINHSKLLSGCSLLQVHINSGKILSKDGAKDFCPTNSWMEKKQIQCALDERRELLNEERVEKWGCLAGATWDHKRKLAEVTRRAGKHFQTLGFEKEGTLYLYPEEALYLLEMNSLELTFGGVHVSIQQGYSLLLGSSTGCSLNEYRTYSHLMRQGYRLLRFTSQIVHSKYERAIRLDQHVSINRSHPKQTDGSGQDTNKVGRTEVESCALESRNQIDDKRDEIHRVSDKPSAHEVKETAILTKNHSDETDGNHLSVQESELLDISSAFKSSHHGYDQDSKTICTSQNTFSMQSCSQDSESSVSMVNCASNDIGSLVDCNSNDSDRKVDTASNDSDSAVDGILNDNDESGKRSKNSNSTAPSDEEVVGSEPVVKRVKVMDIIDPEMDIIDPEIEILDFVPEKKQVELIDLSDESSADSEVTTNNSDSIEVIDIPDTSSSGSSESDSSSSGSDIFEIEETNIENWILERMHILDTIPNMHNMSEILLTAPSSYLLPKNVKPQRHQYCINRWKLLQDNKERALNTPYPQLPFKSLTPLNYEMFGGLSKAVWQPSVPIIPAQFACGIPPNILPPVHWVPNNPWGPRPFGMWNNPQRNNRRQFRSRPYGGRQYRPVSYHRGSNYNKQQSRNIIPVPTNNFMKMKQPRNDVPFQSPSQGQAEDLSKDSAEEPGHSNSAHEPGHSNSAHEPGRWNFWKQKNLFIRGVKANRLKKSAYSRSRRYFNPPRKYTHMKLLGKESPMVQNEKPEESSVTSEDSKSPIMKTESHSSDKGNENENMDTNDFNQNDGNPSLDGDNENTNESWDSPKGVKPLLSPHHCTNFASVFKSVQVIKEADTQTLVSTACVNSLRPKFDLFSPSKPFKKGNPPSPDFHLCIMRYNDEVPAPGEMRALVHALNDAVPVMFAIVSPDSISYIQFCDVSLPSVLDSI